MSALKPAIPAKAVPGLPVPGWVTTGTPQLLILPGKLSPARPAIARPALTVPGLDFLPAAPPASAKAFSTSSVSDPRDGTATVT